MERVFHPRALMSALLAVLLWSFVAPIVQELRGAISFSAFAFYPPILAAVALFAVCLLSPTRFIHEVRRATMASWTGIVISGVCLGIYELCFFYSLFTAPIIEANIVNYLWPVFLVLFSALLVSDEPTVSPAEFIFMLMAFVGASLTASGSIYADNLWSTAPAYVSALSGAISIALSMAILRTLRKHFSVPYYPYFFSTVVAVATVAIGSFVLHFSLQAPANGFIWGLIALEGVIVFALGYVAWIYAIQTYPSIGLASIIYFTPILGATWLFLFFHGVLREKTLIGAALILAANFMLHGRYRAITATQATAIIFLCAGLSAAVVKPIEASHLDIIVNLLGVLLSLLMSFTLARLATKARERDQAFAEIIKYAIVLRRDAPAIVGDPLNGLLRAITDFQWIRDDRSAWQYVDKITQMLSAVNPAKNGALGVADHYIALTDAVQKWLILKTERLPTGERIAIWLLGITTSILIIIARGDSIFGDVAAISIVTGISLLLFTTADLDNNVTIINFPRLLTLEHMHRQLTDSLYLPEHVITSADYPSVARDTKVQTGEMQSQKSILLKPEFRIDAVVFTVFIITLAMSIIVALIINRANLSAFTLDTILLLLR